MKATCILQAAKVDVKQRFLSLNPLPPFIANFLGSALTSAFPAAAAHHRNERHFEALRRPKFRSAGIFPSGSEVTNANYFFIFGRQRRRCDRAPTIQRRRARAREKVHRTHLRCDVPAIFIVRFVVRSTVRRIDGVPAAREQRALRRMCCFGTTANSPTDRRYRSVDCAVCIVR